MYRNAPKGRVYHDFLRRALKVTLILTCLERPCSRFIMICYLFRKALKATFILIPLFGLHQFFLIYQPTADEDGYEFFQMVGGVINNAQVLVLQNNRCMNYSVQAHISLACKERSGFILHPYTRSKHLS